MPTRLAMVAAYVAEPAWRLEPVLKIPGYGCLGPTPEEELVRHDAQWRVRCEGQA